jgi:HPt (histidine-containing phosphotransfer) domain-containing protein
MMRRLATIDGLNLAQGLRSFRGRIAPYQRLLGQFVGAHQQDMSAVLDCLDCANLAEARRLAHSLKGSAAALGAARIQNLAAQLEAALRNLLDEESDGRAATDLTRPRLLARTLEDELVDFTRAVADTLPAETAPDRGATAAERRTIDWPTLRAALERLRALLAEDDMQASDVLAGVMPTLRAALGAEADPLIRAVEVFDFPAALATLRELRAAHAELAGKP